MKLSDILTETLLLEEPMLEMANFSSRRTGLPTFIWFGEIGGRHGPRIKVSNVKGKFAVDDCFVVSVTRDPLVMTPRTMRLKEHELSDIKDWICLNYDDLMKLWRVFETNEPVIEKDANGDDVKIDEVDIIARLKKLT